MLSGKPSIPARPAKSSRPVSDTDTAAIPVIPQRPVSAANSVDPALPQRPPRASTRTSNVSILSPPIRMRPTRSDAISLDTISIDGIASAGEGYDAGDEAKFSQSETDDASFGPSVSRSAWAEATQADPQEDKVCYESAATQPSPLRNESSVEGNDAEANSEAGKDVINPAESQADIINIHSLSEEQPELEGAVTSQHGGYESGDEARADSSPFVDNSANAQLKTSDPQKEGVDQSKAVIGNTHSEGEKIPNESSVNDNEGKLQLETNQDVDRDGSFTSRDDGACTPQTTETRLTLKNEGTSLTDTESGFDDDAETIMPDVHESQNDNSDRAEHHEELTEYELPIDSNMGSEAPAAWPTLHSSTAGTNIELVSTTRCVLDRSKPIAVVPSSETIAQQNKDVLAGTSSSQSFLKSQQQQPDEQTEEQRQEGCSETSDITPLDSKRLLTESDPVSQPFIPSRPKKTLTSSSLDKPQVLEVDCEGPLLDTSLKSQVPSHSEIEANHLPSRTLSPEPLPSVPARPMKNDRPSEATASTPIIKSKAPPPKPKKLSAKMSAFQQMFELDPKAQSGPNNGNKPPAAFQRPQGQSRLSEDKMKFAQSLKGVMGRGIPMPGMVPLGASATNAATEKDDADLLPQAEPDSTPATPSACVPKLRVKGPRGRKLPGAFKEPVALEPEPPRFTIVTHRLFEIGGKSTGLSSTHGPDDVESISRSHCINDNTPASTEPPSTSSSTENQGSSHTNDDNGNDGMDNNGGGGVTGEETKVLVAYDVDPKPHDDENNTEGKNQHKVADMANSQLVTTPSLFNEKSNTTDEKPPVTNATQTTTQHIPLPEDIVDCTSSKLADGGEAIDIFGDYEESATEEPDAMRGFTVPVSKAPIEGDFVTSISSTEHYPRSDSDSDNA